MNKVKEGTKAPAFVGKDQNGKEISLEKLKGKKVILYFYPQDNTPTCNEEACNLRDNHTKLKKKGFRVIGVSADSMRKHQNFIKKFDLPFDLIADVDMEIIKAYGVWGEKTLFGRTYDGILRTTFVIDEQGVIVKRIDNVKSREHAQQILNELNLN